MDVSSEHRSLFNFIEKLKVISGHLLYGIFLVSLLPPLMDYLALPKNGLFRLIIEAINYLLLIAFTIISFLIEYYLFPRAERKRRLDFINHGFGMKFNVTRSNGYYSNNEYPEGMRKALFNLLENMFFTIAIGKKILRKKTYISCFFVAVIIIMSVYGLENDFIALPFLQLFFSANILGEIIKISLFNARNEQNYEFLYHEITTLQSNSSVEDIVGIFLKSYSDYESNLAWAIFISNSQIYQKENEALSVQWQQTKTTLQT